MQQNTLKNKLHPVFSDYQRQCDEELFSRFSLAELKERKRVIQSMRKSLKNDSGWASIFFIYSLVATITVILLQICYLTDTSIESHFSLSTWLMIALLIGCTVSVGASIASDIYFSRFLRRQERTIEKIISLDESKHIHFEPSGS